jgi:hypothetical protein
MPDWDRVNAIRLAVERFHGDKEKAGQIIIPVFDTYITNVREGWEKVGFDMNNEEDVFKLWGVLSITCEAGNELLAVTENKEQFKGAIRVFGTFSNMTGLFLREMTRWLPNVPAIKEEASE